MLSLLPGRTLSRADERRVVAAIARAERGHRGEIQVYLEARYRGDGPLARAAALFSELGLDATEGGTGVLIYVAVADQRAAVWAGPGIHGASAEGFWRGVTDTVAEGFRDRRPAAGLVRALELVGALLSTAAPGHDSRDELPNRVIQR